jgi:hypothetical protein
MPKVCQCKSKLNRIFSSRLSYIFILFFIQLEDVDVVLVAKEVHVNVMIVVHANVIVNHVIVCIN